MCRKHKPVALIGSSGTFDTLSDIYSLENGIERSPDQTELPLTLDAFNKIYDDLLVKTKAERLEIPGMIPLRVDMIVVASVLIDYVLKNANLKNIRVSAFALKEGVLLGTLEEMKKESYS